jgi:hypothetical protein
MAMRSVSNADTVGRDQEPEEADLLYNELTHFRFSGEAEFLKLLKPLSHMIIILCISSRINLDIVKVIHSEVINVGSQAIVYIQLQ